MPAARLGVELAAYRRAAGFTQAQFAKLAEYSRSTIANVETGRQHVPRDFWERADRVLRTGGVLATGYDETETAARHQLRAAARNVSTSRQARTWQPHPGTATEVSVTGEAGRAVAPARSASVPFWPEDRETPGSPRRGQPQWAFPRRRVACLPMTTRPAAGSIHGRSTPETSCGSQACAST